ncbi:hypothetical protein [Streptomyces sp. OE57]|uniref:hypothetical protein n=1 Tax=Streptomyces lacaronensis TaxID=3379885 RepID=UPI0039B78217
MIRRSETPPDVARADARTVVITVRYTGDGARQQAVADEAVAGREAGSWPAGLLSWSLFASTDGQVLMAYEQWADDAALDAALAATPPYVSGIAGTEPSAPARYRVHRSFVSRVERGPVGCVGTPVFDVDGPEGQRHFVDEVFSMTKEVPPMPGSLSAHFHLSADGTRVFNYAEWSTERAHIDAVEAADPTNVRGRITGEIPGVRPCGYRRWHLHTALSEAAGADVL